MKKKIILLVIFLLISTLFFTGCNENTNGQTIDLSKLVVLNNYTVTIKEDMTGEEYREIIAYVSNNAGKGFEMIRINVTFYDNNKNVMFTKQSYINDIENKEIKKFSTVYHSLTKNYYKVNWDVIGFEISVIEN